MTSTLPRFGTAPGRLPGVGHLLAFGRDPLGFLGKLPNYGDLVEIGWGPRPVLVLCHPDLADQVLRNSQTFDKGGPYFDRFRQFFGMGLFTSEREQHRRHRRLLQPLFHRDRIPDYAVVMSATAAEVADSWHAGQVIDVVPEMTQITMQVTLDCMFTVRLPAEERALLGSAASSLLTDAFWRFVMPKSWDRLPTPLNRRFTRALSSLDAIVYRIIDDYRRRGDDHADLLSAMLGSHGGDDDSLTDQELRDNVVTFIFGGTETTAAVLSWSLYFLGQHPDVERQLHEEVDRVLGGRPTEFTDVPELAYTGRIVNEALRMYSPGWIFTRVTVTDTELVGRPIPAGTVLIYCPYLLHRRADLFPEPDRFDPDRWLSARSTSASPHTYAPFGIGTRKCIGDVFGSVEATMALATIASRWILRPVPGVVTKPRPRMTLTPHPLRMRVEERHTA